MAYRLAKLSIAAVLICTCVTASKAPVLAASAPAPAAAGSTLQQRVDQRKAERGITLSDADQQHVIGACVSAQSKIRLVQNDTTAMLQNHTKVYGTIDARLWITIGSLKFANQDSFQLEKFRQTFAEKTSLFQSLGDNYKQSLDDAVVINCKADPVGFRALLSTAQIYNDELKTQSADSRDFIINSIKPDLTSHASSLQSKSSNGSN